MNKCLDLARNVLSIISAEWDSVLQLRRVVDICSKDDCPCDFIIDYISRVVEDMERKRTRIFAEIFKALK